MTAEITTAVAVAGIHQMTISDIYPAALCIIGALALTIELLRRKFGKREINVVVTGNDGSKRTITINVGRDAEMDEILAEVKRQNPYGLTGAEADKRFRDLGKGL